jgi:hypothetical protein
MSIAHIRKRKWEKQECSKLFVVEIVKLTYICSIDFCND